jgi:hypothetical protein
VTGAPARHHDEPVPESGDFNRMGKQATLRRIVLEPANLVRYAHELTVDGLPEFRESIGLDPENQKR